MSIWAIADIHASRTDPATGKPTKPMDLFGDHWANHLERLEEAWNLSVHPEDTVIVAGDTDWGLHLEEALETLARIDRWPGHKLLVRGNHDYWWSSKATNRVRKALPPTIALLHNNAVQVEGFNVCGAKGSPVPGSIEWTDENVKLLNREQQRLLLSLEQRDRALPTIAVLHYPPFYPAQGPSPYVDMLEQHGVVACVYGHLHGDAAAAGPVGTFDGIEYHLAAADAVEFRPVLVESEGSLVPATPVESAQRRGGKTEPGMIGSRAERRGIVPEENLPLDDLGELAEQAMSDKREEIGSEGQARELYDVPTESARDLAEEQDPG